MQCFGFYSGVFYVAVKDISKQLMLAHEIGRNARRQYPDNEYLNHLQFSPNSGL